MSQDPANAYLRTKVLTASPAELRLMLIDGAIRFARRGREGLIAKNYEEVFEGLSQAKSIILELINCLRPEVDPELCNRLSALYTYMYRRLMDANIEKDAAIVDEVLSLLEYERETWVLLMEKLPKAGGAVPAEGGVEQAVPAMAGAPGAGAGSGKRRPLSVEG